MSPADARWQMVTCRDCAETYQCSPHRDYYGNTTLVDGQCEDCMLREAGAEQLRRVTVMPAALGGQQ